MKAIDKDVSRPAAARFPAFRPQYRQGDDDAHSFFSARRILVLDDRQEQGVPLVKYLLRHTSAQVTHLRLGLQQTHSLLPASRYRPIQAEGETIDLGRLLADVQPDALVDFSIAQPGAGVQSLLDSSQAYWSALPTARRAAFRLLLVVEADTALLAELQRLHQQQGALPWLIAIADRKARFADLNELVFHLVRDAFHLRQLDRQDCSAEQLAEQLYLLLCRGRVHQSRRLSDPALGNTLELLVHLCELLDEEDDSRAPTFSYLDLLAPLPAVSLGAGDSSLLPLCTSSDELRQLLKWHLAACLRERQAPDATAQFSAAVGYVALSTLPTFEFASRLLQ